MMLKIVYGPPPADAERIEGVEDEWEDDVVYEETVDKRVDDMVPPLSCGERSGHGSKKRDRGFSQILEREKLDGEELRQLLGRQNTENEDY
jgi:hypothetical protein